MTDSEKYQPSGITPMAEAGRQLIQGYGEGRFTITGRACCGSVLVFPERTVEWPVREAEGITIESLVEAAGGDPLPGILLIGCGPQFVPPPKELRKSLKEAGVTLEWMDTGAACRTFNLLMSDGRSVAAALIAVE